MITRTSGTCGPRGQSRPVSTAAGAPSLSRQTQPLLKFSFSEPVANFCPFHHPNHPPQFGAATFSSIPTQPCPQCGFHLSPSNLFIHSAINKLCALHGSKQTSLLSWRVTLATESQETNNICGVLAGGIKREGGQECWGTVCVYVCTRTRTHALSYSVVSKSFAAPWTVNHEDPLSI